MAASSPAARRTPAKKTAPAKRTSVAVPKSASGVVLDLDALTIQQAYPKLRLPTEPFTFLLGGVWYTLNDPRDSDWKQAVELANNTFLLMRVALVGADNPIEEPTKEETRRCRERHGLKPDPPEPGSDDAKEEAKDFPDGLVPILLDRFTAAHLPTWKLNALFANWHQYYKIDLSKGNGILPYLLGQDQ